MNTVKDNNKITMNRAEWIKFAALVGGFALIGLGKDLNAVLASAGLGLVVWVIWRGRKLV